LHFRNVCSCVLTTFSKEKKKEKKKKTKIQPEEKKKKVTKRLFVFKQNTLFHFFSSCRKNVK
jgi:hypothetical protein